MNKSSIFYVITFIFLFASVSVILAFLWLIEYDQQNYTKELNTRYSLIANTRLLQLNGLISENEFQEQTKNYKMLEIIDPKKIRYVIYRGEILDQAQTSTGVIRIISLDRQVFLSIIHEGKIHLYKDQDYQAYRYFIIKAIAAGIILILVSLYIFIIRKLKPLKALKKQIAKFAQNKLDDIKDVGSGNDEISQVANAFYKAITQIKKLNQSRQFFIRNIMHELKTPITKGLITLEMIEDNKYKERLTGIFNRLEILINEFAAIEQITSGAAFVNRKKYNILDVIDEAKEIAMSDDRNVQISIQESFYINVDFKLFTTAVKNMIDNGIKYSDGKTMQIYVTKEWLCFKNQGSKLGQSLEYYTQAFTQGMKQKDSFGLGLYIVNTILEAHDLKFDYEYKEGYNLFYFKNLEKILVKD